MEIDFFGNPFDQENLVIKSDVSGISKSALASKVNDFEQAPYSLINNPANPFVIGDKVVLDLKAHDRYGFIQNLKEGDIPRVSGVFGEDSVNIAFSYSYPLTIKGVPVSHLKLVPEASFKDKVRFFFKSKSIVKSAIIMLINVKLYISAKRRLRRMKKRK